MRPDRVVVVLGTETGVGKTHVAAALAAAARARGRRVVARKPVQSFGPEGSGAPPETDAHRLGRATGEAAETVCPAPRWYAHEMAPPMAADALGAEAITLGDLLFELRWPVEGAELALVEGAGGVWSPIAHDADNAAFARSLGPDLVVLVADAGLGTINAVRSAGAALAGLPVRVVLNRYDASELHRRNLAWLGQREGPDVVTDIEAVLGGGPQL